MKKVSVLIQESVRPEARQAVLGPVRSFSRIAELCVAAVRGVARTIMPDSFFRKPYGQSNCTIVAAAGDRFRQQLVSAGISDSKIHVTGQPRLDKKSNFNSKVMESVSLSSERALLFCSQPVPVEQHVVDQFFRELVAACYMHDNVRLLVKLHPRDLPIDHWAGLVACDHQGSLLEITKTRELSQCFDICDAMLTIASTTSLEAMAAGLPVGLVNYLEVPWFLPYGEMGAALSIENQQDLAESIYVLLYDDTLRERINRNAIQVLKDELYLQDGKSDSRITDLIEESVYVRQIQ